MLNPETTALLVIDMQKDAVERLVPTGAQAVPAIAQSLKAARASGVSVIFGLRVHRANGDDVERFRLAVFREKPFLVAGTEGAEVLPELAPLPNEDLIVKTRFSCFFQSDLLIVLTRQGIRTLVVCGIQTPNCVRGTVTDALAYDFDVILLDDAIRAQSADVHAANMYDMLQMGATAMTTAEFVASLPHRIPQ